MNKKEYKLFGKTYRLAKKSELIKRYFDKQLGSKFSRNAIVTDEHLKILGSDVTLFGKKIKKKDFLLIGIIIHDLNEDNKLLYTFFYITKEELNKLYHKQYYVTDSKEGVPKFISYRLIQKILENNGKLQQQES